MCVGFLTVSGLSAPESACRNLFDRGKLSLTNNVYR